MNITQNSDSFSRKLFLATPALVTLLASVATGFLVVDSGVVPSKYIIAATAGLAFVVGLVLFLMLRRFSRLSVAMRALAWLIALASICLMAFGSYLLSSSLRTLGTITTDSKSVEIQASKPFNLYISGIDTYGDLQVQSRSDVNILATIKPSSRQVLLTSIPRDSYVPIALGGNDQKDKLTHAGNYGVESSMKTVAGLLDTEIDAYVRINFTSFIESIDKIGGITVNNPTNFRSYGQHFKAGAIALDGKDALVFARERKNLEGGDVERGKNQQRVIQAIIDKITSIRTLNGYNGLLAMIGESVETNLSEGSLRALINQQIESPVSWTTESITLQGRGQTGGLPSYAMPSAQLYMYVLDKTSIDQSTQRIQHMLKS